MDRFPYAEINAPPSYADRSPKIWRPVVPFSIRGLSGRFDTEGLVDTGGVETILPMAIWDLVEPAHREGEAGELAAANGTTIPVKYGTVNLGIKLGRARHWWSALVGFTEARNESVLGDAGFDSLFRGLLPSTRQIPDGPSGQAAAEGLHAREVGHSVRSRVHRGSALSSTSLATVLIFLPRLNASIRSRNRTSSVR